MIDLLAKHDRSLRGDLNLKADNYYIDNFKVKGALTMEKREEGQSTHGGGPENSNQINVSVKKNPNFYVFLGKKYLETHETIELHALGNAVSTSVIASENLVR